MNLLMRKAEKDDDLQAAEDAFKLAKQLEVEGAINVMGKGTLGTEYTQYDTVKFGKAHEVSRKVRSIAAKSVRLGSPWALEIYKATLLFDAPHFFDEYCRYLEFSREISKKFYEPRRKQLLPIVQALQDLEDDKLDLLAISMPPGVGKTTIAIFYISWLCGKHPELQNLICSHNNEFLRGVYDEILRITDKDGEYLWSDVFPGVVLAGTNAKAMRIDFGNRKRFETVQMTAKGSQNAGKVRATNLLYCDDLVSGIEEALSAEQMEKLWNVYTTDFRQRKQGNQCKELHIATRWSVRDVIGRLETQYENDSRARFIRCPALDENDESNFDYPYGLGYSTKTLREQRDIMDDASWRALYQNEPIEREGQLYAPSELRRYFDLPEREPDAIISVIDSKEQGNDFCVMPVAYQFGNDFYIDKFICDNGKPDVIEERIIELLCDRRVQMCRVESNRGGSIFAENINKGVKARRGSTQITTKWNQTNKDTRILVASGWVKQHCLFKDDSLIATDKEYRTAMNFLCGYTMSGKNLHDDVPDAMADLSNFVQSFETSKITVIKRPF